MNHSSPTRRVKLFAFPISHGTTSQIICQGKRCGGGVAQPQAMRAGLQMRGDGGSAIPQPKGPGAAGADGLHGCERRHCFIRQQRRRRVPRATILQRLVHEGSTPSSLIAMLNLPVVPQAIFGPSVPKFVQNFGSAPAAMT